MLLMARISNRLDEFGVAAGSAHILRWTGSVTGHHPRIANVRLRLGDVLQYDLVFPTVPEIVFVD